MKPLIGITGRQFPYGHVEGSPDVLSDALLDVVLVDYVDAVRASGGLPVHLPFSADPAEYLDRLDGLVLSGGADVDPARYNAAPDADLGAVEHERDDFELTLAEFAIERSMPTLGICRGHQVLNVAAGGTLNQHVPEQARYESAPDAEVHRAVFDAGSIVHSVYGESLPINSFHHQTIDEIGDGIRIVGRDGDHGNIEAIEFEGKPIVGVQWHPEMFRQQDPIFDWLIAEAGAASGSAESLAAPGSAQ